MVHETSEPIYITNNGTEDMVIMSVETYEREKSLLDIYRKVGEAEQQLLDGAEPIKADAVFSELKAKYGY